MKPTDSRPWPLRLGALGALGVTIYMLGLSTGRPDWCILAKPIPVLCLAFWTTTRGGGYSRLVTAGLFISMVADIAIEWSFISGLGLFLLAHLVYVAAFLKDHHALRPLRALPVVAALAAAYRVIAPGLGSLQLPVIAYMGAIGTMVWRAAARLGGSGTTPRAQASALVGAICFASSDTLLALNRFHQPARHKTSDTFPPPPRPGCRGGRPRSPPPRAGRPSVPRAGCRRPPR